MDNIKNKLVKANEDDEILSNSQKEAVKVFKDWYLYNRSLVFTLSGSAGTGKSWLINYMIKNIIKNKRVIVSAPTHKAVRVVEAFTDTKGATLHSLHGLRPNFNLSEFNIDKVQFDPLGTNKFMKYDTIVPDEASMIGRDLHKLNLLRSVQYNTKIIYVGDRLQLLPVKEDKISAVFDSEYGYNLTDIIRQDNDNPILDLFTLLRSDILTNTATFLNYIKRNKESIRDGSGYRVLNVPQIVDYLPEVFKSKEFDNNIDSYRIGTYTNASVNRWNKYVRKILTDDTELITKGDRLMGYKTIVDEFLSPIIINSNDYLVKEVSTRITDDKFKVFEVKIEDYYTGFDYNIFIVDHTDKTFTKYYQKIAQLHKNALYGEIIKKNQLWKAYYHYKETFMTMIDFELVYDGSKHANVTREIDYSYAVTIHKLQGSTIDNVIIDGMDICYYNSNKKSPRVNTKGMPNVINQRNRLLYTGLSRTSKIGNILYY